MRDSHRFTAGEDSMELTLATFAGTWELSVLRKYGHSTNPRTGNRERDTKTTKITVADINGGDSLLDLQYIVNRAVAAEADERSGRGLVYRPASSKVVA